MKRRLQVYLEKKYGSAYHDPNSAVETAPTGESGGIGVKADRPKSKRDRAAKQKPTPKPPPDGGRFYLR